MSADASLAAVPNLGPKSAGWLADIGIDSLHKLRETGAIGAWLSLKQAGKPVSLNLLWALEGALTGQPWQQVAREQRTSLLLALDDARRAASSGDSPT